MKDCSNASRNRDRRAKARILALVCAVVLARQAVAEPELSISPQSAPARSGRPYRIVCEVSWLGSPGEYTICPAESDTIAWGRVALRDVRGFVRDGRNVVSQTVEIIPDKPGSYKTPEIRIAYLHPEATSPAETAADKTDPSDPGAPPSLRADPFEVVVRPRRPMAWVSGGLGASLLLLLPAGWRVARYRRNRPSAAPPATTNWQTVQETLHAARQNRLDGKFYECYVALGRAAEGIAPELVDSLRTRAEAAGYRGIRPTDDEIDSDIRAIERALRHKKEESAS